MTNNGYTQGSPFWATPGAPPIALFVALLDFGLIVLAAYCAHALRFGDWRMSANTLVTGLSIGLVVVTVQAICGVYASWRGRPLVSRLLNLCLAWGIAMALLLLAAFILKVSAGYSRLWLGYTVLLGLGSLTTLRIAVATVQKRARIQGHNLRNVVLIECPGRRHAVEDRIRTLDSLGYRVTHRVPMQRDSAWLARLADQISTLHADELWLCLPLSDGAMVEPIAYALRHQTVDMRYIPDTREFPLLNYRNTGVAGMFSMSICSPIDETSQFIKRAEDLIIGGLISVIILPVCALIAAATYVNSPGPVIFKQTRTGIKGRKFTVYKFRSMEVHQEANDQVTQAQQGDPRITRLGAFLRRTSLDELPQFYNVLRGDMSIVGPRPHALAHNEFYKDQVELYMKRHKVKPGITGWAQVNGYRGLTDTLDKMQKRVQYDLWYINNWSLGLDIKIILWTIFKGFLNRQP